MSDYNTTANATHSTTAASNGNPGNPGAAASNGVDPAHAKLDAILAAQIRAELDGDTTSDDPEARGLLAALLANARAEGIAAGRAQAQHEAQHEAQRTASSHPARLAIAADPASVASKSATEAAASRLADAILDALERRGGGAPTLDGLYEIARATEELRETERTQARAQLMREQEAADRNAYQGYRNAETATVMRHLESDPRALEMARGLVGDCWANAVDEIAHDRDATPTPELDAADALKGWLIDEENPFADGDAAPSLYGDLLQHALIRVDWDDIAAHFAPQPLPSLEPVNDYDGEDDPDDADGEEEPDEQYIAMTERERDGDC